MTDEIRTEALNNACDEVWELIESHSRFMNSAELDEFTERIHSLLYEVTRERIKKHCVCPPSAPQDFNPDSKCPIHGVKKIDLCAFCGKHELAHSYTDAQCVQFISTKAEQSSSYYKSEQSEHSSQFRELLPFDHFLCKYQHGRTVVDLLAHRANTLKLNLQAKPGKDLEQLSQIWPALYSCEEVECLIFRRLVALVQNSLRLGLMNSLPTRTEHYSEQPAPLMQLPDFLENLDPPQPEGQSADSQNSQDSNQD